MRKHCFITETIYDTLVIMAHNLSNTTEEDQRGRAQEGKRQFRVRNDD